ncbi:hypothetical protein DIPPA_10716, partial [Diplonema papillatum]
MQLVLLTLLSSARAAAPDFCPELFIQNQVNDVMECPAGSGVASRHVIEMCEVEVCAMMNATTMVEYDGDTGEGLKKDAAGECRFGSLSGKPSQHVCGPSVPYTKYMQVYDEDFLPDYTYIYDVALVYSSDLIVITGTQLYILELQPDGRLKRVGRIPSFYYAAIEAQEPNVIFAMRSSAFDIIDLTTPSNPKVLGTTTVNGYGCDGIVEYKTSTKHVAYVGCGYYGTWVVDISSSATPVSLGNGTAMLRYSEVRTNYNYYGYNEGVLVDTSRNLLFSSWALYSMGLRMHDISTDVAYPSLVAELSTSNSPYQMELLGTVLYVAANEKLLIFETASRTFEDLGDCCDHGPAMLLKGLYPYEGLVYASDYYGKLVMINATDPSAPFYMGHRELPPSSGSYAYGREGIVVGKLADGLVRVYQAAYSGGLIVWSDVEPAPTPVPFTPLPAPPPVPMDCSHIVVHQRTDEFPLCPDKKALVPGYQITECSICSQLAESVFYDYDGLDNYYYKKTGSSCGLTLSSTAVPTHSICGSPAPHTMYVDPLNYGILPPRSRAMGVAVLGSDENDVAVATSSGVTIIRAEDGGFRTVAQLLMANTMRVEPAEHDQDVLYVLSYTAFSVITLTPPEEPVIVGTVAIPNAYSCIMMEQIRRGADMHVVYAGCQSYGMYAIDVRSDVKPTVMNPGGGLLPTVDGNVKGLAADEDRQLLFIVTTGSGSGVYMYDTTNVTAPSPIMHIDSEVDAHDLRMYGTVLYVAAAQQLQIYETTQTTIVQASYCCEDGPTMNIWGVDVYGGLAYVSDYSGKLLVINVTNYELPHYVTHKEVTSQTGTPYGTEGIVVSALGDGIVRVFHAVQYGGLMVYSDVEPPPRTFPPVPVPAPPLVPPDCSQLEVNEKSGDEECAAGHVLMSKHMIDACSSELCSKMTNGWSVGYDGDSGAVFTKSSTSACAHSTSSTTPTRYVCGPAPPYTMYSTRYDDGVLPAYSVARDISVGGVYSDVMYVAGSYELTVMRRQEDGNLKRIGRVAKSYYGSLLSWGGQILFGMQSYYLDVISVAEPTNAFILGTRYVSGSQCAHLAEYWESGGSHVVFASCPTYGVYTFNVTDTRNPVVYGGVTYPSIAPESGNSEGIMVDVRRGLLFLVSSGVGPKVYMYNISHSAGGPIQLHSFPLAMSAFELTIEGTRVFVAAQETLEIFETVTNQFVTVTSCCAYGPEMHLVGLYNYGGLVYASDYKGRLVVMNVTGDSAYYIGHRDLPAQSAGNSKGKNGIVVSAMDDDLVRVFIAGDAGGLIVFSDIMPMPTPAPNTPLPPPPSQPLDCAHITIEDGTSCPIGFVHMSEHLINSCFTSSLCDALTIGTVYAFDTNTDNRYVIKTSATSCAFSTSSSLKATMSICGTPPPHTTYVEGHKASFFPAYTTVYDVAIMGSSNNDIVVCHSQGLAILRADDSVGFQLVGKYLDYPYSVLRAVHDADLVYMAVYASFRIVSLTPPESPSLVGSVTIPYGYCYQMEHLYVSSTDSVVYVSCGSVGVVAVDVTVKDLPQTLNQGSAVVSPLTGNPFGIRVDSKRNLLFVATQGNPGGIHMYNITTRDLPLEVNSATFTGNAFEVRVVGTVVYVTTVTKLRIYETTNMEFEELGFCCQTAPYLSMRAMDIHDGLAYIADYFYMLVVVNVTDPYQPYYVGHRTLPKMDGYYPYTQNGVEVTALQDGVVRVFVAGGSAGLFVFSDTLPAPTPTPPTPLPAPPMTPPDCSQVYIFDASAVTDGSKCDAGHVLMSEHFFDACPELCSQMASGYAGFDSALNKAIQKTGSTCAVVTYSKPLTNFVCGPAPPFTTYRTTYDDGYVPTYAYVRAVEAIGSKGVVLVGNNYELTVLQVNDQSRFKKIGSVSLLYGHQAFLPIEGEEDLYFGLRSYYLDVIDMSNPAKPVITKTYSHNDYYCFQMEQYKTATLHYLYLACDYDGYYIVDVTDLDSMGNKASGLQTKGQPRGVAIDAGRQLLFLSSEAASLTALDFGLQMYDLSKTPADPELIVFESTEFSSHGVILEGTLLYVAMREKLTIYQTKDRKFEPVGWCCSYGPSLDLRFIEKFGDAIYASDYYQMLVVVNVSNPEIPYYIGHRDMPSGTYGYEVGVSMMTDNSVHVFQAAYGGGMLDYSDVVRAPTPVPATPFPPPPPAPIDCDHIVIAPMADRENPCPKGQVRMPYTMVARCLASICDGMNEGELADIDYTSVYYFLTKYTSGTCGITYNYYGVPTKAVCGTAPPHTSYLEAHKEDVLVDGSYARDVAVLGEDGNDVLVATTKGLTVLHALHSVGFKQMGHIDGNYQAVLSSDTNKDMAFALMGDQFDVISVSPPDDPTIASLLFLPEDTCKYMSQYTTGTYHYVYVGCGTEVFVINARDNQNVYLENNRTSVVSTTGSALGMTVDNSQKWLFLGTDGSSTAGVNMYSLADPVAISLISRVGQVDPVVDVELSGTTLYAATLNSLAIFTVSASGLTQVGTCCTNAPSFEFKGIAYHDGYVYASDYYYQMIVMDVSSSTAPLYAGHRMLPIINYVYPYGQQGIVVAPLGDGIVRVFQAGESGGLMVFSDEEPLPTPSPPTLAPPPPMVPPSCGELYVHEFAENGKTCKVGHVMISTHILDACSNE